MRLQTETIISLSKETLATHPPDVHSYNNLQLWKEEILTIFNYKYLEFNQYSTNENKINLYIIKFDRCRAVCAYIYYPYSWIFPALWRLFVVQTQFIAVLNRRKARLLAEYAAQIWRVVVMKPFGYVFDG